MTNLKSRIMKAAEFDHSTVFDKPCESFAVLENQRLRPLIEALADAVTAMEQANYEGDYYDQKPHKAMEVVYKNREALANLERVVGDSNAK